MTNVSRRLAGRPAGGPLTKSGSVIDLANNRLMCGFITPTRLRRIVANFLTSRGDISVMVTGGHRTRIRIFHLDPISGLRC